MSRIRWKSSKILAEYPSSTNPGKSYHVILGNDGVTYCDCWQWKLHRTCKHLKQYNASVEPYKRINIDTNRIDDKYLEEIIRTEVGFLSS